MFRIRLLRALTIGPRRVLPGGEAELDATSAAEVIRSGAGRLVDDRDLPKLIAAVGAGRPRPVTR